MIQAAHKEGFWLTQVFDKKVYNLQPCGMLLLVMLAPAIYVSLQPYPRDCILTHKTHMFQRKK